MSHTKDLCRLWLAESLLAISQKQSLTVAVKELILISAYIICSAAGDVCHFNWQQSAPRNLPIRTKIKKKKTCRWDADEEGNIVSMFVRPDGYNPQCIFNVLSVQFSYLQNP